VRALRCARVACPRPRRHVRQLRPAWVPCPRPSLSGFRLVEGDYQLISEAEGRLRSEVLGLHLESSGQQLRRCNPKRGVYLLTPAESREALERESAARQAAEAEVARLQREIEDLRRAPPTAT